MLHPSVLLWFRIDIMTSEPLRIGLLWHSLRSANLGVGALTIANIAILRAAAAKAGRTVIPVVIGFGGPLHYSPDKGVEEVETASTAYLLPGSQLWKALGSCSVILDIGGGDSWADLYGGKRFFWMWWSKQMALLQRRPLVLSPQTIGPFDRPVLNRLAGRTMKQCERIFTRDTESMQLLKALGAETRASETVDVAFRLPFQRMPCQAGGPIRFGFNVSGLLYAGGYKRNDQFGSSEAYRAVVDGVIAGLLARRDVEVSLVPHVLTGDGSAEDDAAVSYAIAARYPRVKVAPSFKSPGEAKGYISSLDLLAGSRMHATIAAASSGVAVVPLAYSRKFRGVFSSIGYPLVADCISTPPNELISVTLGAVDRRSELSTAAAQGAALALDRLEAYENYLAELLRRL